MNKKNILYVTAATIFLIVTILLIFLSTNYSILRIEDIVIMIRDNKSPAITIPHKKEEYFNKWQCFDVKNIEITEAEIYYRGKRLVPYIQVNSKNRSFEFHVDPVINCNKDAVIKKWNELINRQKAICIFAAYLQTDVDGTTVWYIQKLKTKNGYWDISDRAIDHD
jgi:hypothetical protein